MKKIIYNLAVGLMMSSSITTTNLSAVDSVVLYRRPVGPITTGIIHGFTGLATLAASGILGAYVCVGGKPLGLLVLTPLCTLGVAGWLRQSVLVHRWNKLLKKPSAIFDRNGFTYEKIDFWGNPSDHRHEWKDVVRQWNHNIYNPYGLLLEKNCCYQIKGSPDIIKINMLELEIPKNLEIPLDLIVRGIFD